VGPSLLGDKAHSLIFDNTKIKRMVRWQAEIPFWRGAVEIVEWHKADPARRETYPATDAAMDRIIGRYGSPA